MGKQEDNKTYEKMTPEEKEKLANEHKEKHRQWLHFIIKDKQQSLSEYQGKPKQCRILANEIKHYEKELSILQRFTQPVGEEEDMCDEAKELYGKIINKQIAIVANKKDTAYCDQKRAEIRALEKRINELEGKTINIDDVPF